MYTELELVNHILSTQGVATTPTLNTQHPAVLDARAWLATSSKEFQGIGWWFNRERGLKLLPDVNGRVRIPTETLTFQVTACALATQSPSEKQRFVKRGQFIYDNILHTNQLNVAVWVDICILLDISDLPSSAGSYLKHYAAEGAFLADDGDIQVHNRLQVETAKAWAVLKQDELKAVSANALQSPGAYQLLMTPGYTTANPNIPGGYV